MRVLLVAGGWSPEREISLRGARSLEKAMIERGHDVTMFDLTEDFSALLDAASKHDVAFLNLHGAPGEDGLVQALLDRVGCPYQGASPAGSFLALHKTAAKALFSRAGLTVPQGRFFVSMPADDWQCDLTFPVFVKSNTGGSSLHLARAENNAQVREAMKAIFAAGDEVLIETQVVGKEVSCGVLQTANGLSALPPVLIVPKRAFFDYHDKYSGADGADEICPAPLPQATIDAIQAAALCAHRALGLEGYSRTDCIVSESGEVVVLETNTLPGMTDVSLVPREAAATGLPYGELIETLLQKALQRVR